MAANKKSTASCLIDHQKEIVHPLDYSFKAISDFSDLLREKPRRRDVKSTLDLDEEESLTSDDSALELLNKSNSSALKLNNNMLANWEGFWDTINGMFINPTNTLQWIDLSFNDIKTIDEVLCQLPNLTMLYLHGNNIRRAAEMDKLSQLCRLRSLTLHGNPVESLDDYRYCVLSKLPQLINIDFSTVTKQDRKSAQVWSKATSRIKQSSSHRQDN